MLALPSKGLNDVCSFEMSPRTTCGAQGAGWEGSYRALAAGDGHCCLAVQFTGESFVALLEKCQLKIQFL